MLFSGYFIFKKYFFYKRIERNKKKIKTLYILSIIFLFIFIFNFFNINIYAQNVAQSIFLSSYFYYYDISKNSLLNRINPLTDTYIFFNNNFGSYLYLKYLLRFYSDDNKVNIFLLMQSDNLFNNSENENIIDIPQFWIKINTLKLFKFIDGIFLGKKIVNWDEGFIKNPTDIVNNKKYFNNISETEGKFVLEVLGNIDLNLFFLDYDIITVFDNIEDYKDLPLFICISTIVYPFEFKLKGGFQNNKRPTYGLTIKGTIWDIEITFDMLYFQQSSIWYVKESSGGYVKDYRNYNDYLKFIIYLSYGFEIGIPVIDRIEFTIEYFEQQDGWNKNEGENYFKMLENLSLNNNNQILIYSNFVSDFNIIEFYEKYLFGRISFDGNIFDKNYLLSSTIYLNLVDNSFIVSSNLVIYFDNYFKLNIFFNYFYGDKYKEFGEYFYNYNFGFSISKSL